MRHLGERFLLLKHRGRSTGEEHETVLEVVHYDTRTRTPVVASGWGKRSDWVRNLEVHPDVRVTLGGRRFEARAVRLPEAAAAEILLQYSRTHPLAFRQITHLMTGEKAEPCAVACQRMAKVIPLVRLEAAVGAEVAPPIHG
ncbi:MAG TPA: nitroreductase family deazaflavin-dependent oxidoreductase [Anaerolineales bacterium]|nr:nitroreductase family deazaflavin-dependent oxidoreductase [Anaerolineales bacterium]